MADSPSTNRYVTRSADTPAQLAEASTTIKQEPLDEAVSQGHAKESRTAAFHEASSSNCSSRDPLADEIEFGETRLSFQNAFFNVVGNEIKSENIIADEIEDSGDIVGSSTKRRKTCDEDSGEDSSASRSTRQSMSCDRMLRCADPARSGVQAPNSSSQMNGNGADNCTYVIQVLNETPNVATEQAQPKERLKTVAMTQKQMLHFIRLVEERDVLWNRNHPEYKDLGKQGHAWTEISNILNIPEARLVEKWKSLYGSYRCYLSKVLQSISTDSSKAVSKPSWFAYDAMNFMRHLSYTKSKGLPKKSAPLLPTPPPDQQALSTDIDQAKISSPEHSVQRIPRIEQPMLDITTEPQKQDPCTPPRLPLQKPPVVSLPSTSVVDSSNRVPQRAEMLPNEAESLEILSTSTNHTVQQTTDAEAAQFGHTVSEIFKHVSPERRMNLFSKMIEVVHNQYTFDQDVLQHGRAIMHLLQNMAKSKRKFTYNGIVNLINHHDQID